MAAKLLLSTLAAHTQLRRAYHDVICLAKLSQNQEYMQLPNEIILA